MDKAEQPTTQSLKPCPFCGGEAELRENGYQVHCATGCTANVNDDYAPEAIAAWNARTTSLAAQDGLVEAVAEALLSAFLAGRGSVTADGRKAYKPAPSMADFRNIALSAIKEQHHD